MIGFMLLHLKELYYTLNSIIDAINDKVYLEYKEDSTLLHYLHTEHNPFIKYKVESISGEVCPDESVISIEGLLNFYQIHKALKEGSVYIPLLKEINNLE